MAPNAEANQDDKVGEVPGEGGQQGAAAPLNNGIQRDLHPGTSGSADVVLALPNFELIVKQQDFDPRESQVEYVVQVTNPSQRSVRLLSLRQSVPPGVEVQHVRDLTLTSQREHLAQIFKDLSFLLSEFVREERFGRYTFIHRVITAIASPFSFEDIRKQYRRERAWRLEVTSVESGNEYYEKFVQPHRQKASILCDLFEAKLQEAKRLLPQLHVNESWIIDLPPGATYSITYIFVCERKKVNPKSYTFEFDCSFRYLESPDQKRNCRASVTVDINPSPLCLNLIAVGSSVLGAGLNKAISLTQSAKIAAATDISSQKMTASIMSWITDNQPIVGTFVAAMITALFFFNAYDSMQIGRNLKVGSGWRSALLIGGLSGLATDKVVTAVVALLN